MPLNEEDRILIKNLYCLKGYGAKRLMKEFPTKGWKKTLTRICSEVMRKIGRGPVFFGTQCIYIVHKNVLKFQE
mgnify:FL=1